MWSALPNRTVMLVAAGLLLSWSQGLGQDHVHDGDHVHAGLHFTHPLIAESLTPDTKLRLDHQLFDLPDGDQANIGGIEAEYAFHRSFSIEAGLPFSYDENRFGNLEVGLKFANFVFEGSGILLGYGLEIGFPTAGGPDVHADEPLLARPLGPAPLAASRSASQASGGDVGEADWELSPFLNVGLRRGRMEFVAWGIFGIPFALEEGEEAATEIGYNLSVLYHASARLDGLIELDGAGGISGPTVGDDVVNLSPGIRFRPVTGHPLVFGASVGFPITSGKQFDTRWSASVFWHF